MKIPLIFKAQSGTVRLHIPGRHFWDYWGWIGVAINRLTLRLWWTGAGNLSLWHFRVWRRNGDEPPDPRESAYHVLTARMGRVEFDICRYRSDPAEARPDLWGKSPPWTQAPRSRPPRLKHLRNYLRWRPVLRTAARAARVQGLAAVLPAMWKLNRHAQTTGNRYIYRLKNHLVRHLYLSELCTSATIDIQRLLCRSCRGTGDNGYGDGWCPRCDGTGTYRTVQLYRFVFFHDRVPYVWHQPAALVDWPVELTDPKRGYYTENPAPPVHLAPGEDSLLFAIIHAYLIQTDTPAAVLPEVPTLAGALRQDFAFPIFTLRHLWRRIRHPEPPIQF